MLFQEKMSLGAGLAAVFSGREGHVYVPGPGAKKDSGTIYNLFKLEARNRIDIGRQW